MGKGSTSPALRVGVTGGIGSGKSAVCSIFSSLGRTVLRADDIARELTEKDPAVRREVRAEFGAGVFRTDGTLDRKALAAEVFADPARLARLNAIVHPAVFAAIDRAVAALPAAARAPYVVIEAALVFESGMDERLDYVVVVHAGEEVRIRRVMERDGTARADVAARMRAQMPADEKLALADFVIRNDGTLEALREAVRLFDTLLTHLAAGPTA